MSDPKNPSGPGTVLCPTCRSTVTAGATVCWLCHSPLSAQPTVAPNEAVDHGHAWLIVFVLAMVVLAVVGVELVLVAPGMLPFFLLFVIPALSILARMAWVRRVDFWKPRAVPAVASFDAQGTPLDARGEPISYDNTIVGTVLSGVAIGASLIAVFIGVTILAALAAVVVLLVMCFGIYAVNSP